MDGCLDTLLRSRCYKQWCVLAKRSNGGFYTLLGGRHEPIHEATTFGSVQEDPPVPQETPSVRADGGIPEDGEYIYFLVVVRGGQSLLQAYGTPGAEERH